MIIQPWWALVWALLAVAAIVAAVLVARRRSRRRDRTVPVAHVERLTALPGYRAAMRRYRAWLAAAAVVAIVGVAAVAGLTMRPAREEARATDAATRDIVLCLDVSGSMVDYDSEVVDVFADLAKRFEGERLSLVVFNASAVTYFPLTTDLDYIEQQFTTLQQQFRSNDQSYFQGTLNGDGSSLVGDGLASCVTRFDQTDQQRSRSVVLVTDNVVIGKPIYTLPQAGQLATSKGVRVYGINPGDQTSKQYLADDAREFEATVRDTQGDYFALDDPNAIPSIVSQITAQQVAVTKGPTHVVLDDTPALAAALAALALIGCGIAAWRLRR